MRSRLPVLGILLLAGGPVIMLLALTAPRMVMVASPVHAIVVGLTGAIAAIAATSFSVTAARRNDGRTVWLGTAFSVMALMLMIHALATPGALIGENGTVQLAGALNMPLGGLLLAGSGLPLWRRPQDARGLLRIQLLLASVLTALGVLALALGSQIRAMPAPAGSTARVLFVAGAIPLLLLAWRAARTFLLTRRPTDMIVTAGVIWLIGAEYGFLHFTMMNLAWWSAHLLELLGIAAIGIPAALDLRHAVGSRPLTGTLRAADLVANEEIFLGGRVRALLVRLGEKDPSTEGHTRRVAALAVELGERLGLPHSRLRQLALGGLLHDIGKLAVPHAVLSKPGRLSDQEFAQIRRHPALGRDLLTEIGGFPKGVLEMVEGHHERLDGGGYPNGAPGAQLAITTRILTVADVYDALTAERAYKEAWPAGRALALLEAESGTAFDGACVAALRAHIAAATTPGVQAA